MNCGYDSAGPWDGGRNCSGRQLPAVAALGQYLVGRYGGSFQGYNCRPNTADASQLSQHGTGRALDYFPESLAEGSAVAELLVEHWEAWGVQLVIWNRRDWTCAAGWTSYGGPNPHTDHLHIELRDQAARSNRTADYYREELIMDREVAAAFARQQAQLARLRATQLRQSELAAERHRRIMRALGRLSATEAAELRESMNADRSAAEALEAEAAELDAQAAELGRH